jgi:hypothetical protein
MVFMKEIKEYISYVLLVAYACKTLSHVGNSLYDAGIIVAILGFISFREYMAKHKKIQEINDIVLKQNDVIKKMAEELVHCKDSVTSIKLQNSFKQPSMK